MAIDPRMMMMAAAMHARGAGGGMGLRDPNDPHGGMNPNQMRMGTSPPPGGPMMGGPGFQSAMHGPTAMGGGNPMLSKGSANKMLLSKADGDGPPDMGPPGGGAAPPDPTTDPTDPWGKTPTGGGGGGGGGGGSFFDNLPDWLRNQGNNFSGVLSNPLLIPSLGAAWQQFHQSREYTEMAERYAGQLDPFGKERGHYQDLLRDSYDHPETVLNDPAHMAELNHGLDNVGRKGASAGLLGSGNIDMALQDYAHTSDADWLTKYRQGLQPLTGEQFGPDAAGQMLRAGMAGRMGAENNAVGNLMAPFLNQSRNNDANNRNPNGPGGPGPHPNISPQDVARGLGSVSGPASQWIRDQIRQGHTVDPNDPHVTQAIEEQTPQNYYNNPGAPPGSEDDNTDIMNNYGGSQPWNPGGGGDPSGGWTGGYDQPGGGDSYPWNGYGGGSGWWDAPQYGLDDIDFSYYGGGL